MILRPPTKIITLLALLFVLFTGYYPKHESFEGTYGFVEALLAHSSLFPPSPELFFVGT